MTKRPFKATHILAYDKGVNIRVMRHRDGKRWIDKNRQLFPDGPEVSPIPPKGVATVDASLLSNLRMTAGNEKKYPTVIDNGVVKKWVGIGWIRLREATKPDLSKYPTVIH